MKYAADFRADAREALRGRWPVAILTGIAVRTQSLATLLWLFPLGIPLGIGYLFLMPYQEAAYAAFYRDISGTAIAPDPALPEGSPEWF